MFAVHYHDGACMQNYHTGAKAPPLGASTRFVRVRGSANMAPEVRRCGSMGIIHRLSLSSLNLQMLSRVANVEFETEHLVQRAIVDLDPS